MNFKYALRSMRKNPLITGIAIVSLALGIGANTAIFSLIDQLLLRTLPVENPRQLVQLAPRGPEIGAVWRPDRMSYPMYRDIRDKAPVFRGVLAWYATPSSLGYGGRTERIRSELVTGGYFQVLGVKTAIGRAFTPEDDQTPGAEPLAMLTYDFWRSRFGGDPNIVGATIHLNGNAMTVIGVAARGFRGLEIGEATQVFVPMAMQAQIAPDINAGLARPGLELRRSRWVSVFARLKPGITIEQARAGVAPLYRQIIEAEVRDVPFQRSSENTRQEFLKSSMDVFDGSTGRSALRTAFRTPLYALIAISGIVLLIACANVSNLLIARATTRQKEIAVRLALGASRAQIVAQLMVESLLVSGTAAVAGLGLGVWVNVALLRFIAANSSPLTITATLDSRVLAFTLAIAFATACIFGLVPALQATKPRLADTLKSEAGGIFGGRRQTRVRKMLVIAQVSLSLLLLITSSLFIRSLSNLHKLNPGFRKDHVIAFSIDPSLNGYTPQRIAQFYRDLLDRLRVLPGVSGAGQAVRRVLDGREWRNGITVEGYAQQDETVFTHFNMVSARYFDTLGIPLVAGRDFAAGDMASPNANTFARVCIVNEAFARKYFADGAAVGRHVGMGNAPGTAANIEIVAVARDTKYDKLRGVTPPQMFVPLTTSPSSVVYVRTTVDPDSLFGTVGSAVREMDPSLPIFAMRTLEEQVDESLAADRMIAMLSSAFGSVATLLAMIGLYGVMAFTVARRAREIAIRISLGAQRTNVLGLMMREVAAVMLIGIAIAIPAYMAVGRSIASQLYGIEPGDTLHIAASALFLLGIGLVAGYIPSRRALRVDPISALRGSSGG